MKNIVKRFCLVLCLALTLNCLVPFLFPMINCTAITEAATVKLNKTKIAIKVGETYQLELKGTKSKIAWTSSKKSIATVSSDGLVTGIKSGNMNITAKVGSKSYLCIVTVLYPTLNKSNYNAGIGDTLQLAVKNLPLTYDVSDITFKSDNNEVVTVNNTGLITAISEGYCNIMVTFGTYRLQCWVMIKCPATLNMNDITIRYDEKEQIIINDLPKQFTLLDVKWAPDNKNIITIDNEGYITALSEGYTNVKVSFGSYKLNLGVTVPSLSATEASDFMDKLEYEHGKFNNQEVIIYKNNTASVNVDYQIEYYDSNDSLVSVSQRNYISLVKGKEAILYIDKCDKEYSYFKFRYNSIRGSYESYGLIYNDMIDITATEPYEYSYEYYDYSMGIPVRLTDTVKLFDLVVDNRTIDRLTVNVKVIYYKDNSIVDIKNYWMNSLDVGITTIKSSSYDHPFGKIYAPEYDKYRIIY